MHIGSQPADGIACAAPVALGVWAGRFGGRLDPEIEAWEVRRVTPIDLAREGDLAPFTQRRLRASAAASRAIVLVDEALAALVPAGRRWVHPFPSYALAQILGTLRRPHPAARVDPSATVAPGAVILDGAVIEAGVRIEPNAVVYGGAWIEAGAWIGAGSVIGREGFGFAVGPHGATMRIPQLGGVRIGRDAELGPLCTVDAGTLGPTTIGRDAKLDAQVHVGHNARIGDGTWIAAQSGFAGSAQIGRGCRVGGQVGVADHVRVADGAHLAAKAGVIGDVPAGAAVAGYPAVERTRWLRATATALRASATGPRGSRKDPES